MPIKDVEKRKEYHKRYYREHLSEAKKAAKKAYEKNKKFYSKRSKEWLQEHFEYQLYRNAKTSAKQRGLSFDLLLEDIIIPEYCPYLGIKLTKITDGGRQETNASLDRIDNTKGYVKDNIQVISSKANFMKRNASIEELKTFAKNILAIH